MSGIVQCGSVAGAQFGCPTVGEADALDVVLVVEMDEELDEELVVELLAMLMVPRHWHMLQDQVSALVKDDMRSTWKDLPAAGALVFGTLPSASAWAGHSRARVR